VFMWFGKRVVARGREGGGGETAGPRPSGAFPPSTVTTPLAHSDSFAASCVLQSPQNFFHQQRAAAICLGRTALQPERRRLSCTWRQRPLRPSQARAHRGVPPPLPLRSMFAACAAASGVVYFNQVNIPPLPSGDWLRLRDGPSLLEEQTDTTRTGDLASVGGTVWPAAATLCSWLREQPMSKPSPM
jgi:hypothetical protein